MDIEHGSSTTSLRRRLLPLALIPLGAIAVGCGGGDALGDAAAEQIAEAAGGEGTDVDIDSETGEMKIETEEGTFSSGTGELPEGWPSDIPLPSDYTITASTSHTTDDGDSYNVAGEVEDGTATFDEVTAALVADGWTELQKSTADYGEGSSSSSTYENAQYQLVFSAMALDDGTNTFSYTVIPAAQ
jgi:hypothetical protein